MARIDAALHGLQPVRLLQALAIRSAGAGGTVANSHSGSGGSCSVRPHIGPQHAAALDQRIGFELDPACRSRFPPAPTARRCIGRSRRISSRDRGSAGRPARCGRTTARRRDGRRTRRSGRAGRRCRGTPAAARTASSPAPAGSRSRAIPRRAAPAASSCGTAVPPGVPGPVWVRRSFCSFRSIECLLDCVR